LKEAEEKISGFIGKDDKPIIKLILTGEAGKGFKESDFELLALAKKFEGKAIVEVSKDIKDKEAESEIEALRNKAIENISIKDFGTSVFLKELESDGYKLDVNPTDLFEALSSEKNKEKAISKALSLLFKSS